MHDEVPQVIHTHKHTKCVKTGTHGGRRRPSGWITKKKRKTHGARNVIDEMSKRAKERDSEPTHYKIAQESMFRIEYA